MLWRNWRCCWARNRCRSLCCCCWCNWHCATVGAAFKPWWQHALLLSVVLCNLCPLAPLLLLLLLLLSSMPQCTIHPQHCATTASCCCFCCCCWW